MNIDHLMSNLPAIGDARKRYAVELTEPEINLIHAFVAFVKAACAYPATADSLSARLAIFDDGNAPLESSTIKPNAKD